MDGRSAFPTTRKVTYSYNHSFSLLFSSALPDDFMLTPFQRDMADFLVEASENPEANDQAVIKVREFFQNLI